MNSDQINAAIAQACGWTDVHLSVGAMYGFPTERKIAGIPPNRCTHNECPNYCSDLNAMHDAEEMLGSEALFEAYYLKLYDVTHSTLWPIRATARHRAEAFLRVMGKWEEADLLGDANKMVGEVQP